MPKKIVITGLGMVSPVGIGVQEPWNFVLQGKSAVDLVTHFDVTNYRSKLGAEVRNWQPENYISTDLAKRIDKVSQFSLAAAKIALTDSGLDLSGINKNRVGVCVGTGLGGIIFAETQLTNLINQGPKRVHPLTVPNVNPNIVATLLALEWNFLGPNLTICTACASSTHAIGQALMLLQTGKADIMVTGGTETPITPMTFAGFDAMRVMSVSNHSPKNASRPFDANRDGFVIGEGACMLTLETESNAKKRGARIYAELAGYAANNGGHHMVIPTPDGRDAAAVMLSALEDAGLSLDDIDYINAHGTSTQANDLSETNAIKAVWGKKAYQLAISSTKGATGHLLGATGAIEAAFTALSIYHGQIPPTANYETVDPNCDLDYVPITSSKNVRAALSNSFGFGNNNACLVFKKWN